MKLISSFIASQQYSFVGKIMHQQLIVRMIKIFFCFWFLYIYFAIRSYH